jgi:hypothetical protein
MVLVLLSKLRYRLNFILVVRWEDDITATRVARIVMSSQSPRANVHDSFDTPLEKRKLRLI